MNEENEIPKGQALIDYRLTQIESKLDQVTNLLLQTQAQEIRLSTVEKALSELKNANRQNIDRWLNPIVSAVISGLIAFIFLKVGLK